MRAPFGGLAMRPVVFLFFALAGLAGCATPPPASDPDAVAYFRETNDPLEPTNRVVYAINNGLDTVIMRPAARAYAAVVPAPGRRAIHNVLSNLGTPVRLANDMLQGKPRRAGDTVMRFLINTTAGVGGIFDVADGWGYPNHSADFGVTLALWGLPEGPYLFLPVLGPSDARDAAGFAVDVAASPFIWVGQGTAVQALRGARIVVTGLDERALHDADIEDVKRTALDPYATFRSLYRQMRHAAVEKARADRRATVPVWFAQPADASPG